MVQGRIILLLLPAAVYLEKEYSTLDLEVEDVLVLQNNCELSGIKDKLVETNRLFWRAVDNTRNLPHNINLIIPPGICQEQNYNRTRRVQGSAFITSSPGSIVQPGACGEPGYQLNLGFTNTRRNRQLNENLENMVYLTRFLYGVFPEHGVKSSSRFPLFYRNRSEVELNSCTNIPVKGNFTEQCIITQDCLDRIEENQINVTSSLLFSTDTNKFENLERYCTRTTHVKSSPTLQNLVCSEKSVMEVLDFKDEVQLLDPVINILQREEIDAFFFILDTGEEMRKNSGRVWSVLRAGLAPSYKTWPDSTKLTVRYSGTDPMNITDVKKQNLTQDFIKTKVFPESLLGFPNLPLAGVHLLYQNMQLIAEIGFPNIIIVTASSESYLETEYKQVLEFITKNRIPVFVLTFSSAPENPELVNLAKFGSVFSIPLSSGEFINGGETWSVLLHNRIINSARSLTPVYKIGKVQPSMYNTSQRFQISPQEINNPGYFLFLCRISEFEISVEAPDRRNFSTSNGDILPVWDGSVPVLFLDSGQWSGNWRIIVQPKLQTSSSGLDILFSSNSAHIRPTLWNQFSRDPQTINGSVTPAVRVYSSSSRNDLSQPEFQVQVLTPSTESIAVTVRDDGLLSPDALDQDGVFSGYFYSLNSTGYYMLWREERIEVVGNLGYRYLTLSPALYVSQPSTQGVDLIPPGRIVDLALVSVSTVQNNVKVSLRFTEPGDDNFDNGVPQLYYIHCGESRENISYQLCSSIRGRVRLPATPRQFKTITLTVKNFDVEVYIGITAQDRSGNMGEMSNIVEVYISSPTTTSTSSTSISTTVISDEITESEGSEGVSLVLFWSIVAPLLALLIILLLCLLIFVFSWNYRKRRERRLLLEEDMRTYRLQDNPEFQVSRSSEATKNIRFIKRSRTKTNGSLRDIEKPLSDSSSHSDSETKEKARRRRKKRKGSKTDIPDPVYTISQTINHIKVDQDKRDDRFYPNSSLESKPGAYRYKTRAKGLAPGLSRDHNPKYLNNNPPGRVGPPVLPKPSYYNPNSSSRDPQNIQIEEPREDIYTSSQPSNYLSYINNSRLPAIYSTESTVNSEIMKNYENEFEPRTEKRKPFNYIVQSEELSLNKPSNKKNSKNFVSFV